MLLVVWGHLGGGGADAAAFCLFWQLGAPPLLSDQLLRGSRPQRFVTLIQ